MSAARRSGRLALVLVAAAAASFGAEAVDAVPDSSLRIQGIFNSSLPGTERRNFLRLIFHPHLGDLSNRDHLRVPFGVRYGLTDRWEATAEFESYFSHGRGQVPLFEEAGFSQIHLGTKYHLPERLPGGWDAAVGIDWTHPLGSPPGDVTDGLTHIAPFATFARRLDARPDLRVFWGLGADLVNRTTLPATPGRNELGDDAAILSAGLVWDRRPFTYTLEGTWGTTSKIGGPREGDVFSLRPGVVWKVPIRFTPGARSQWLLGLGLRATRGPDGTDFGASAKVRVNFDFKRLFGRHAGSRPSR